MPLWKVFVTLFMAAVCLILAFATIVVPMSEWAADQWYLWALGLLVATGVMGWLFSMFLRSASRAMKW